MPKRKRSAAQLAADKRRSEAMKAKLAQPAPTSAPDEIVQDDNITKLLERIEELERRQFFPPQTAPVQSTRQVITKYSFDPKNYEDPSPRIAAEERLKPFAFDYHYELVWDVKKVDSEEDGQKIRQPRFELELWQKILNDDNQPTKKFRRKKWMFFEDPDSYIAIANQKGIDVPEYLEKPFLDEMRYLNFRDAIFEVFFPPKTAPQNILKEEVIANQLVSVVEMTYDVGTAKPDVPESSFTNPLRPV